MSSTSQQGSNGSTVMTKSMQESAENLASFLRSLEMVYRWEMPDEELEMWIHSLNCFPLAEVRQAVTELMKNPPDGWTGMPKLPDVVRTIWIDRERRAAEIQLQEGTRLLAEMKQLKARADAGERFYGMADLEKLVKEKYPDLADMNKIPAPEAKYAPAESESQRAKLEEQKRRLMAAKERA